MTTEHHTRETWLNAMAALMAPKFAELGHPLPAFRAAIGFTGAPKESKVAGVCWHTSSSADRVYEIFISPDQADPMTVAAILAHELTHAAVGFKCNHKGDFAKVVLAIGLLRPLTSTVAGPAFKEWVQPFIDQLGALPHAPLSFRRGEKPARPEGDEGGDGEDGEGGGSSNDKKKQTTRMLKATCAHEECGYTVRLSKKWASKLGACCPVHGAITIEGLDLPDDDGESE